MPLSSQVVYKQRVPGAVHPEILWRQKGAINAGMRPLAGVLRAVISGAGQDVGSEQHLLQSHRVTEPRNRPWGQVALPSPAFSPSFFPSPCTWVFF